jgi:hypothetical protein
MLDIASLLPCLQHFRYASDVPMESNDENDQVIYVLLYFKMSDASVEDFSVRFRTSADV